MPVSALDLTRSQVVGHRVVAHGLARRLAHGGLAQAAAATGFVDHPRGSVQLALAQRVEGVGPLSLFDAIHRERSLVVTWTLHGAAFVVPAADLDVFSVGLLADSADPEVVGAVRQAVRSLLDGRTVASDELAQELRAWVCRALPTFELPPSDSPDAVGMHDPLLHLAALTGEVCFGGFSHGAPGVVRVDQWLTAATAPRAGGPSPDGVTGLPAPGARAELGRRFLHAYGPADATMLATWAGVDLAHAAAALADLEGETTECRVGGRVGRALTSDVDSLRSPASVDGVRLLVAADAFLAQPDQDLLMPDDGVRDRIWRVVGSPGVVLVDGDIAALWRPRKRRGHLEAQVEPVRKLGQRTIAAMQQELELLAPLRKCTTAAVIVAP